MILIKAIFPTLLLLVIFVCVVYFVKYIVHRLVDHK